MSMILVTKKVITAIHKHPELFCGRTVIVEIETQWHQNRFFAGKLTSWLLEGDEFFVNFAGEDNKVLLVDRSSPIKMQTYEKYVLKIDCPDELQWELEIQPPNKLLRIDLDEGTVEEFEVEEVEQNLIVGRVCSGGEWISNSVLLKDADTWVIISNHANEKTDKPLWQYIVDEMMEDNQVFWTSNLDRRIAELLISAYQTGANLMMRSRINKLCETAGEDPKEFYQRLIDRLNETQD